MGEKKKSLKQRKAIKEERRKEKGSKNGRKEETKTVEWGKGRQTGINEQ